MDILTTTCKELEDEHKVEFILSYGFASPISPDYINDVIFPVVQEVKDSSDRLPLTVIIGGHPFGAEFRTAYPPVFSYAKNYALQAIREGIGFFERVDPSTAGENIQPILSPSNAVFAELDTEKNILYVLYNIFDIDIETDTSQISTIVGYLIDKYLLYLGFSVSIRDIGENNESAGFIDQIKGFYEKRNKDTNTEISVVKHDIENLQKTLFQKVRKFKELQHRIEAYANADHLERELKQIISRPDVLWADIKDDYLLIATERIHIHKKIRDTLKIFDIGNIMIKVNLNTSEVYFDNLTQRRQGVFHSRASHPHDASSDGSCRMCLGEIAYYIPELIADLELSALTELLLNYARSVNIADVAGKTVFYWPTLEK
ncbi:MAG: hypothetical protein J5I47_08940 [Vicingus serpentipes]|nr:hypothetical protein [Vicingus serpentipes]